MRAIEAGVDFETPDREGFMPPARTGPRRAACRRPPVDEAVRRMLRMKFEAGLFENPYADAATAEAKTATPDAIALAREAAQKAIVLLKNDKGLLPLNAGQHSPHGGGRHPCARHADRRLQRRAAPRRQRARRPAERRRKGQFEVDYAEGVRLTETRFWSCDEVKLVPADVNRKLIAEAVETARNADVVVMVLGDNEQTSREAWADNHLGDRASLDLVGQQDELARAIFALGKPTVVMLLNGRPLSVNYLAANAPALIEGWYLGQETGNAVADVLFGAVNPGGKLPVSFARHVGQLPIFYNRKPTARRGYLFDTTAPLYPFGFGLSYTTLRHLGAALCKRLSCMSATTSRSRSMSRNTGRRAGDEVVQLYVRDDEASVTRPVDRAEALSARHAAAGRAAHGHLRRSSPTICRCGTWT